jgi:WD40 repeat protein
MIHLDWEFSLALGLDGDTLISGNIGYINSTINVWDLRTGRKLPTFMEHRDLASIALSRDGQTIVSSSYNGTIKVWGVP